MDRKEKKKFVYEDNSQTKVVKGYVLEETEFYFKIKPDFSDNEIIIGKRAIIKVEVLQ